MSDSILAAIVTDAVRRSTVTEVSRASGVDRSLIHRYMDGSVQPSLKQLQRILDSVGLRLELSVR